MQDLAHSFVKISRELLQGNNSAITRSFYELFMYLDLGPSLIPRMFEVFHSGHVPRRDNLLAGEGKSSFSRIEDPGLLVTSYFIPQVAPLSPGVK